MEIIRIIRFMLMFDHIKIFYVFQTFSFIFKIILNNLNIMTDTVPYENGIESTDKESDQNVHETIENSNQSQVNGHESDNGTNNIESIGRIFDHLSLEDKNCKFTLEEIYKFAYSFYKG